MEPISGSRGTVRLTSFEQYADAEKAQARAIKRRLSHGYTERGPSPRASISSE